MDTKQDILKIVLGFYTEDLDDALWEWAEENLKKIEEDEEIGGKSVISTTLYEDKTTGLYYEVTQCRDNSGYWGDGESYEPEVCQVWRIPAASWQTVYKDPEAA